MDVPHAYILKNIFSKSVKCIIGIYIFLPYLVLKANFYGVQGGSW